MSGHQLGTISRDLDGDLLAVCICGEADCAQPWPHVGGAE